jgi:hypothetical protein
VETHFKAGKDQSAKAKGAKNAATDKDRDAK